MDFVVTHKKWQKRGMRIHFLGLLFRLWRCVVETDSEQFYLLLLHSTTHIMEENLTFISEGPTFDTRIKIFTPEAS